MVFIYDVGNAPTSGNALINYDLPKEFKEMGPVFGQVGFLSTPCHPGSPSETSFWWGTLILQLDSYFSRRYRCQKKTEPISQNHLAHRAHGQRVP